jgi:hypothetical protein
VAAKKLHGISVCAACMPVSGYRLNARKCRILTEIPRQFPNRAKKSHFSSFISCQRGEQNRAAAASNPTVLLDRPPLVRDSSGTGLVYDFKTGGNYG